MIRLLRRDAPGHGSRGTWTDARIAAIRDVVAAESEVVRTAAVQCVVEQARRLAGASTCWLAVADGEVERAGPRGEDALATSLASACLEDGREQTRGDLVAVAVQVEGRSLALVLRFGGDGETADVRLLTSSTALWVAHRLRDLARHDQHERAAQAELRALRAQISPHFLFNALGAIAAMMRIDAERARDLLLEFADYTRYSFGRHGDYTSLAEELRAVETYLALERARFGDRLRVHVLIPPEVLGVSLPFLVLQPLVENAVRHGVEPSATGGTVSVVAHNEAHNLRIEIEDDGPGMDPAVLEARLGSAPAESARSGFGLRSVDERLRAIYGDSHGLVIETAPGAGTKIVLRIPKYRPEVRP